MDFMLSLRVVFPLCVYIVVGMIGKAARLISPEASASMSRFTFRALFPLLVFENVMNAGEALRGGGLSTSVYLLVSNTVVFILLMVLIPLIEKSKPRQASLIQGAFRSNSILFALPIVTTICGADQVGVASICVSIVVPWYNILCVIALETKRGGSVRIGKLLRGIITNPLILGALAGAVALLLGIEVPEIIRTPMHTLTSMVTPLALVLLGADLKFGNLRKDLKQIMLATSIKLIFSPLLIVGLAWLLGFRGVPLISIFALSCVPTAVSSYTMAVEMGADGPLAGGILAATTVCSTVSVFLWVLLLSAMGAFAF
ncbi:MAG: AEC family transporter [Clostridiales bacterium]|nr:AEC family transporter [Clostridiales bacterium]